MRNAAPFPFSLMHAMTADFSWIRPEPHGIHIVPADAWVDPSRRGAARLGDSWPCRSCARRAWRHHRYARDAGDHEVALRHSRGRGAGCLWREPSALRGGVTATFVPAGHVLGSAQILLEHAGERVVITGDYKRRARSDLPAVRGRPPATSSSPRRPSACRSSLIRRSRRRSASCSHALHREPRSLRAGRRLCAGQGAAGDRGIAPRRAMPTPIYLHGAMEAMCRLYEDVRRRAGRSAAGLAMHRRTRCAAQIVVCPALRAQRPLEPPPARSDHCDGERLDARAPARPAAQRRTAAGDFRPCRLERADPRRSREVNPQETWITHGREEALLRWCELNQRRARALALVGYEDEDD